MEKITIKRKITSENLTISQLKRFIGKEVEITIKEKKPLSSGSEDQIAPLSADGILAGYADPNLVNEEKSIWTRVISEKHGDH